MFCKQVLCRDVFFGIRCVAHSAETFYLCLVIYFILFCNRFEIRIKELIHTRLVYKSGLRAVIMAHGNTIC